MLVKSVVKSGKDRGTAIEFTPEECIPFALNYGLKKMNTLDKIYWVRKESIKKNQFHSAIVDKDGGWEATASGTALVGWTDTKTDMFYDAKPHTFSVHYKRTKDPLGLPDLTVLDFKLDASSQNPTDLMGFSEAPVAQAASPSGKVVAKIVKKATSTDATE